MPASAPQNWPGRRKHGSGIKGVARASQGWLRDQRGGPGIPGAAGRVVLVDAPAVATELLADVGSRLAHTRAVAAQADRACHLLEPLWATALVDAAWLHDVGYAPLLVDTGFHSLDGARWLRANHWPDTVCRLVAWHTRAGQEARLRDLHSQLQSEFPQPPAAAQTALTWADLTSSPTGERCTAEERVASILARYPAGSVVHRATIMNLPDLFDAAEQIERRLGLKTASRR